MARTLSIFVAGVVLLIAAACMASSRSHGLFYETSVVAPVTEMAEAAPAPAA